MGEMIFAVCCIRKINLMNPCGVNVPDPQAIVKRNKSELLNRY